MDFYLGFLARCLSLEQAVAPLRRRRTARPRRQRPHGAPPFLPPSLRISLRVLAYLPVPMPPNMRDLLLGEELIVKLSTALSCLELFITIEKFKQPLKDSVTDIAFADTTSGTRPVSMVNLDEVMSLIRAAMAGDKQAKAAKAAHGHAAQTMQQPCSNPKAAKAAHGHSAMKQAGKPMLTTPLTSLFAFGRLAENERLQQRTTALQEVYEKSDVNDAGLLEFSELRLLCEAAPNAPPDPRRPHNDLR